MKRILFLLAWLLAAGAALACEVTFSPAEGDVGNSTGVAGSVQIFKDGVSISISNGLVNTSHYRVYKGQTITICSEVGDLTRIEFTCTAVGDVQYGPAGFVADTGDYSWENNLGVWSGRATCVTFTAMKYQVRITSIKVTYDCEGTLLNPVITPPSGTYYEPIEVSMSCPTDEATIHYTVNGSIPTAESTEYTAPFTLGSDATVKAVAVKDGETSDVVVAEYAFGQADDVGSIAEAVTQSDEQAVRFTHPVKVLAQHGRRLFITDETGCALIYGDCGQVYVNGDIIPGGFVVTKTTYNGEPEFTNPQGMLPAIGNEPVRPLEITADQVGHDLFAHYVHLDKATFSMDGNNYTLTDEQGNTCAVYFESMGVSAPYDLSSSYEVYAVVGSYGRDNIIYQLLPVDLISIGPDPDFGLCSLGNIPDNTPIVFSHSAIVVFQYNNYLYLKDDCGYGLVYGPTGQTYHTGDVIPPGWGGIKKTWSGEPELGNPSGFQPAIDHVLLEPEVINLTDVGHDRWAHLVMLKHVRIDYDNRLIIDDEGHSIPYYPQLPYPVDPDTYLDLTGVITSYGSTNTVYQLMIIDMGAIIPPPPGVCCISELQECPQGQVVPFICPLTVVYQHGVNLYVKDSCGEYGLMYGQAGGPFENGDLIQGNVKWSIYQGNVQLIPAEEWEKVGETDPVEPEEVIIEEICQDMIYRYFCFMNVKIVIGDDGNAYIDDGTGLIRLFDKFNCGIEGGTYDPCDVNRDGEVNIADVNAELAEILGVAATRLGTAWLAEGFDPDATYDVWGFLNVYKGEMELYPVRIVRHGSGDVPDNPYDVNGDGEVTLADVNCIVDRIISH